MTEWRAVPGYEGYYEVSDTGLVRGLDRVVVGRSGRLLGVATVRKGQMLSQSLRHGYPSVSLNRDGGKRRVQVHHLVLQAFVGARPDGMQACHNDGNRRNNDASNLRWDTAQANILDCIAHGTQAKLRVTRCPKNHPYDEANTIHRTHHTGAIHRACRACKREHNQRRRKRAAR